MAVTNNRIFWAVQALGFAPDGVTSAGGDPSGFKSAHGVQSVGITTTFNLEQVFELGQLELYENVEGIPDIELTAQKVLDGYPLLYHLATPVATSPTLVGRSNEQAFLMLNIYPDTNDNATGVPCQQVGMSGMFVSALTYTLNVEGASTEDITMVGNNKQWTPSGTDFPVTEDGSQGPVDSDSFGGDVPLALASSGGVQQRENVKMGPGARGDVSIFPTEIAGITSSGTNEGTDSFGAHMQTVTITTDLGREELLELGRRAPYHRFVSFPVEVTTAIDVISSQGDLVDALADPPGGSNLTDQIIDIVMDEGSRINVGSTNKLASVTYGGGDAGGGNVTVTYNYSNFNILLVTHPQDPAGLTDPT